MTDATDKPQILEHINKSLTITIYDTKWIPCSARFVCMGTYARSTGSIQVYELAGTELKLLSESEKKSGFKCGTFGASALADRYLATGDFAGDLTIWDLERMETPIMHTQSHVSIVNAIDGMGGPVRGYGAPEIATGGRDGRVCVWDPRQKSAPVAVFEPADAAQARDCWTVAFGNSFNDEERCVLAGYDNGDVKMFDLRTGKQRWETNVGNGVCAVEFDRKDIAMNKFVAATLESSFNVFDARTLHPEKGFARVKEKCIHGSTVWTCKHLPQNRDIFMVGGGDGSISLYKYSYPSQRQLKDDKGVPYGVPGEVKLVGNRTLSTQPISCFDWSPDKEGLSVMGSFDQCVRVGIVTKLHKL
eukprot:jgi/Mesvir1/19598/Mv09896-RA.2